MAETTAPVYFDVPDLARFCACDQRAIRLWCSQGTIAHFRTPGGHLRFKPRDVRGFLERFGYDVPPIVRAAEEQAKHEAA